MRLGAAAGRPHHRLAIGEISPTSIGYGVALAHVSLDALRSGQASGTVVNAQPCRGSAMKPGPTMRHIFVAIVLCLGLATAGVAQTTSGTAIEVVHAFARATGATAKTGVAYLTIINNGAHDDRLVAASSPVAEKAEPHSTTDDNGVMRMRPFPAIEVKAGSRVELKPGGIHLMLMGLRAPLKQGQSFPLMLTFEKAGAIETTVTVEAAGAKTGHDMKGMKM